MRMVKKATTKMMKAALATVTTATTKYLKRRSHLDIDIDLSLTGYANARTYYDQKRSAVVKETKTLQSSAKALKSTERKIQKDLKQAYKAEKMELRSFRRQGWWEKFYWFVSSEGYLVLGAKDPTQADMLYKKYFKRGDVWVHADVPGSCHVVVKNKVADMKAPVPPGTLGQAGSLAVASSDAWDKKQVISAWWAEYEQVGKMGAEAAFWESESLLSRVRRSGCRRRCW